jgi:deazaflavin-dependent oxidoreductase (nitroreductase family)
MEDAMATKISITAPDWQKQHLELYLRTDGAEGHLVDFTPAGGSAETPNLLLKTIGKRSGEARIHPLIYGKDGENFVIVASKGGAEHHPAWFLNLEANPAVGFQVVDKKFSGTAMITEGAERKRLFDMMAKIFPPYIAYQEKTEREIPVIVLKPEQTVERL